MTGPGYPGSNVQDQSFGPAGPPRRFDTTPSGFTGPDHPGGYPGPVYAPTTTVDQTAPASEPEPGEVRNPLPMRLVGALIGLVGVPVGLGLLMYGAGSGREHLTQAGPGDGPRLLDLALLIAGGLVLLGVTLFGKVSATAPVVGGLAWGVAPGVFAAVLPLEATALILDVTSPFGGHVLRAAPSWLLLGAMFAVGVVLVGGGLAARSARRRTH